MARKQRLIEPAFLYTPKHTSSAGEEAADLAESAGLILDPEQRLALDTVLAERRNRWAALEAAIIEARQNGKTVDLKAIVLAGLYLFDEELIVWSAHLFTTTQEAQRDLVQLIDGAPHLSRRVKRISIANGEESIELLGGQRVLFKARTKTGGRGLTGDRVILDEAFALSPAEMGSLLPTLSARPNPQVLYASSAGLVGSQILRSVRDRGREGKDPSLAYIEWCADDDYECDTNECTHRVGTPGCVLDDQELWRQANPAIERGRMSIEYLKAERRALPPEEFARERLGWWDEPADGGEELLEHWGACADEDAEPSDPITIAVDVAPGSVAASITACGSNGVLEVLAHRRGSGWVVPALLELGKHEPSMVGLDPSGPAGALIPELERAGFEIRSQSSPDAPLVLLSGREVHQACGAFYASAVEEILTHRDQPILNDAVAGAVRRVVGDAWKWSRRDSTVDISPLVAATVARYLWSQPEDLETELVGELMA